MNIDRKNKRKLKKRRSRFKPIVGTIKRPRLCINRTNLYFSFQLIDDINQTTMYYNTTRNFLKHKRSNMKIISMLIKQFIQDFYKLKQTYTSLNVCIFDKNCFMFKGNIKKFVDILKENKIIL